MHQDDPIDFQIAELIGKYLRNEISAEELAALERWQLEDVRNLRLWKKLNDKQYLAERLRGWPTDAQSAALWDRMHGRPINRLLFRRRIWWIGAVAVLFLATLVYTIQWHNVANTSDTRQRTAAAISHVEHDAIKVKTNVAPSAGVMLITDGGEQIALEGGQIHARQLEKLERQSEGNRLSQHHTIKTAVANTYQVELSDGTKVWLNAASSLRYPVRFEEKARNVFLVGEAYFDVAEDASKPFTVVTDKSCIQVLGTEFNIRSYPDELQDRTSLFTGYVNVQDKGGRTVSKLTPGYDAIVSGVQDITVRHTVASKVLAWKNNLFIFENEPLVDLMGELATWYGLKVHFEDAAAKTYRFTGRLKRYPDVHTLLDLISETAKVTFRVNQGQVWINSAKN